MKLVTYEHLLNQPLSFQQFFSSNKGIFLVVFKLKVCATKLRASSPQNYGDLRHKVTVEKPLKTLKTSTYQHSINIVSVTLWRFSN